LQLRKKTLKRNDKPKGSSLSFAIEEKQSRMITSRDPSSLSFSTNEGKKVTNNDEPPNLLLSFISEEKKLRDDDKLGGSSLFPATQGKPTSRFFSWVAEYDDEPSSFFGFLFFFFLEL